LLAQVTRRDARVSPLARVQDPLYVQIGPEVIIGRADLRAASSGPNGRPGIVLKSRADIHDYVLLDASGGQITIGSRSVVNHFCFINGEGVVTIGDDVIIGPGVAIISGGQGTEPGDLPTASQPTEPRPITIEDNVQVGANVTIQGGVRVGSGAIIGSGVVLRMDVPSGVVVGGVPTRTLGHR
jgi:acetyltransferase-like isoleucine patch superfamily enzyme